MKTTNQTIWKAIDTLLETMWQHSAERAPFTYVVGRKYNSARARFIRTRRKALESAAYNATR